MAGIDSPFVTLQCGIRMPSARPGAWRLEGRTGIDAMLRALELGQAVQSWCQPGGRAHVRGILRRQDRFGHCKSPRVPPSQAVLRWEPQRGIMAIPGS